MNILQKVIEAQNEGKAIGIYSICSANRFVIEASMLQALKDRTMLLIEPTVNQVNQFGGYTGYTPKKFIQYIYKISKSVNFNFENIVFGSDHLGPNPWKKEKASSAMDKARKLVGEYINAGYTKIHLDTSIRCADDPGDAHTPIDEEIIANRAAELCEIAENSSNSNKLFYVIGTEVPIPGGAEGNLNTVETTKVASAKNTLEITKRAFFDKGLEKAWDRVIAQVVQPGVEFGNDSVVDYNSSKAKELSDFIEKYPSIVFEAHSTDYQLPQHLRQLVQDHFAILKVGPWLTYSFREGVFALAMIEKELQGVYRSIKSSNFIDLLEKTMINNPESWIEHYHGNESTLKLLRKYSYSDRLRYYWQKPIVNDALNQLLENLSQIDIPLTLISQFLPDQYSEIRSEQLAIDPKGLILNKIQNIVKIYSDATQFKNLFIK